MRFTKEQIEKSDIFFGFKAALKAAFPQGIPLVEKPVEGEGESSYHVHKTAGYVHNGKGDVISDALIVEVDERHVFDPRYLVADLWGNIYVYPGNGRTILIPSPDPDRDED